MKRILIFSLTYHPYIGGAEVALKEITDRLSPDEYEFHMVTLRFDRALPKVERVGNILVHRIGFTADAPHVSDRSMPLRLKVAKMLFPLTAFWKAFRLDNTYVYDAVWAMMANQAGFAALFFKYTHPKTPYLLELQDGRAFREMTRRRRVLMPLWWLYKRIYLKADRIKAISRFIEKEVRAIGYRGEVEVIPNAVDVQKFSTPVAKEKLTELAQKYGKTDDDTYLFTASRLVLSRGVEDTIRALRFLPAHVKLLVAGTGEDAEKLEAMSEEVGKDRVHFLGHVPHEQLPAYYQFCDVFVRPSIIEGFGNAFVEAFAAGIPVVATPVGGIPDFLTDGETGFFCEVRNPESVARAVERVLADKAQTASVVARARALAAEKYDWDIVAKDMRAWLLRG